MNEEQETEREAVRSEEEKWPAVNRAYDFVIPSYQLLAARFESADTRLSALLTLSATLTVGTPIFAKNVQPNISFASLLFLLGLGMFLLAAISGICGRIMGSFALPDPMAMYEKSLDCSEWEFKKNQIYFAGQHFDYNIEAIRQKGNIAICVTVAMLLEVLFFAIWIVK